MKARVLLTGSGGFIGRHLIKRLSEYDLSLLTRSIEISTTNQYKQYQGDINSQEDYSSALEGCDYVIHCAARVHVMNGKEDNALALYREVNTFGTLNLARQAAQNGVKRFIFISSVKVNGESTSHRSPFNPLDEIDPQDHYGHSKAEAENLLLQLAKETGLEVVIIRPPLVYGPGVKANFASLFKLVSRGFPMPFSAIRNNKRSLVYVANLVDLIVTCVEHPDAVNQVFMVSDEHDLSTQEMIEKMSEALGVRVFQVPVPASLYHIAGKVLGKSAIVDRLIGSLQVDISHTKTMLSWTPPHTIEEGFSQTAKAYRSLNTDN